MLDFQDRIPELTGQSCTALLAQEYWYGSELADPANVLFLQCDGRIWHRFFIDAGVVFWRSGEEAPFPPGDTDDTGEYRYVLTDLGQRAGVTGQRIASVQTADLPGGGEIRLAFVDGAAIVLRDVDDTTELEISNAPKLA